MHAEAICHHAKLYADNIKKHLEYLLENEQKVNNLKDSTKLASKAVQQAEEV
jgi:hypothetical protein